jgi:5-methyltetrahydropteroyltriglutamate--homocysteine methyltransferase
MIATQSGAYPLRGLPSGEALLRAGTVPIPAEERRVLEDRATREAIDAQAAAGLDLVTDGLVRRADPVASVMGRLAGIARGGARERFPGSGEAYTVAVAETEVSWRGPILVEDFLYARAGSPRPVKVVLPGPFTLARLSEDRAYGDPMALAMALAAALNQELRALQAAGAGFIEIDEPALLLEREEFPTFTRIWEVLGRGVGATLSLHLEGGDVEGIYPGVARLKRLACLSLDAVRGPANLDLLLGAPPEDPIKVALGVVDGGGAASPAAESLAKIAELAARIGEDRLLLTALSGLDRLTHEEASVRLRAVAGAAHRMEGG